MTNKEKMLASASKTLGMTPEALKSALDRKDLNAILSNMKPGDAQKLQAVLKNPKVAETILKSPEGEEIAKKIND